MVTVARMSSAALQLALTESTSPDLRTLPWVVARLLAELDAPPRLAAHLRAVHDVACQLTTAIGNEFPTLRFDRKAVLFGAATHDIGKTLHVAELSEPGSFHEEAGYELLVAHGVEASLACFARTHGTWTAPDISTEELMVSLADKIWKGKRLAELEDRLVQRVSNTSVDARWQVFMRLDDILDVIGQGAGERLAFQARHPVTAA
jgi:HD domain-containing protein